MQAQGTATQQQPPAQQPCLWSRPSGVASARRTSWACQTLQPTCTCLQRRLQGLRGLLWHALMPSKGAKLPVGRWQLIQVALP